MLIHTSLYGRPRHKSASSLQRHFISQHILRNIMKIANRQATTHKTQQTNTLTHTSISHTQLVSFIYSKTDRQQIRSRATFAKYAHFQYICAHSLFHIYLLIEFESFFSTRRILRNSFLCCGCCCCCFRSICCLNVFHISS